MSKLCSYAKKSSSKKILGLNGTWSPTWWDCAARCSVRAINSWELGKWKLCFIPNTEWVRTKYLLVQIVLNVISSINWESVIEMISLTPLYWYARYVTFYKMYLSARKFSLGKNVFALPRHKRFLVYEAWYNLEDIDFLWRDLKFSVTHKHCL